MGTFIRIPQGYQDLFGFVAEVGAKSAPNDIEGLSDETGRWMRVQLVGEAMGGVLNAELVSFQCGRLGAHHD